MPIYRYKGLNEKGKAAFGKVVGFSESDAERKVKHLGLDPVWIIDITSRLDTKLSFLVQRVRSKDLVIFSREFSLMISSNISVVEALMTIVDQTDNLKLQNIISQVIFEVDSGALLSDSLAKNGKNVFSGFYINVVKAGEASGKLDEVLAYLADEMEKDYDLLAKFRGAMIYPALVFSGLVGVGFIMMMFVMPQLTDIIQETGAQLPLATRVVISVVEFFQSYWALVVIALIGGFIALRLSLKTKLGRDRFDLFKIKIPVIGKLFRLVYLIRFCRALSTLLYGGVTITRSLEVSADVVRNAVYQKLIDETLSSINEGHSVSHVFGTSPYVPKMIPEMMAIGEKTGKLDETLEKISTFYTRELNAKLANLNVIIEPLIIMILAIGVGVMVAAILLPMYNIATSF